MKSILFVVATCLLLPAFPVSADWVQWQCRPVEFCTAGGYCWTRQQCCVQYTDSWGNVSWKCEYR